MKCLSVIIVYHALGSPSMRREWIEMQLSLVVLGYSLVSLHAEGVD